MQKYHVKELMRKVYEISLKYEQTVDEIAQWAGTLFPLNIQEKNLRKDLLN